MRTRRKVAHARVSIREITGKYRTLPNLLIIGGQRCGTSSLFKYLAAHPQVSPSLRKEVDYFTFFFDKGEDWYRAHFPFRRPGSLQKNRVQFEATPNYMLDPRAAERAFRLVPDARVIALLRDPVKRAWSHFNHNLRRGADHLPFEEAIRQEEERTGWALDLIRQDPGAALPKELSRYSYVRRGLYAEQLEPWLNLFGRDRLLVLSSEEFYSRTEAIYQQVLTFLELPAWSPDSFENFSYLLRAERNPKGREQPMADHLRQQLAGVYQEPNQRLASLLDRDFEWTRPLEVHNSSANQ